MINKLIFFFTLVFSMSCWAQKPFMKKHEVYYIPSEPVYHIPVSKEILTSNENTLVYLQSNFINKKFSGQTLALEKSMASPLGTHLRFRHIYKGLPVYQSYIQANYDNSGQLFSVIDALSRFETYDVPIGNGIAKFWINSNYGLSPAYEVISWDSTVHQPVNRIYNIENKLMHVQYRRLYFQDSQVTAMVYLPNPTVAANTIYGGPYSDNNDRNNAELTAARSKVRLPLRFENGKFKLTDGTITIKNIHDPRVAPVEPTDTFLNFTRDSSAFEDVNAFYHLHTFSNYLRKSGYGSLLDTIHVDTHGNNGDDDSFFDPSPKPIEIEYGTGNVDDAEDGQVVIHEFTHSLSYGGSPNTANGADRISMEEGQADYVSMSYSRFLSPNHPNDVFSWDGHNEFWKGFVTNSTLNYKNRTGFKGVDREIWSHALMCIYDKLGRAKSDSLVFSSFYLQASNSTMPQMARVVLKIDSVLFKGKHVGKVWQCFTDRGILDTVPRHLIKIDALEWFSGIQLHNTTEFSRGTSAAILRFSDSRLWEEIDVMDGLGRKIQTLSASEETSIEPWHFKPGVYYLRIWTKDRSSMVSKKLVRY